MKAVFFDGELKFVRDYPVPEPGENEALVRVSMAGICNTDLEIIKGYMGFRGVIGHEFVGRVEEINGKDRRLAGLGCLPTLCNSRWSFSRVLMRATLRILLVFALSS